MLQDDSIDRMMLEPRLSGQKSERTFFVYEMRAKGIQTDLKSSVNSKIMKIIVCNSYLQLSLLEP